MNYPDKRVLHSQQSAWAHSQQAPVTVAEDTRTHADEVMTAHQCSTVNGEPASGEGHGAWPRNPA